MTAPYKEIAALLNTSVGNVGSQIARLRRELMTKLDTRPEAAGGEETSHVDARDRDATEDTTMRVSKENNA